ncbi:MAG: hypothetical protein ACLFVX_05480 [Archaeoglobaceae archaeon]
MSNCCGVKLRINGELITLFEEFCTSKVVISRSIKSREGEISFKVKFNSTQPFSLFKSDIYILVKVQSEDGQFETSGKFNLRSGSGPKWSRWFTLGHIPEGSYSVSISFWEKPLFAFDYGLESSISFNMDLKPPEYMERLFSRV